MSGPEPYLLAFDVTGVPVPQGNIRYNPAGFGYESGKGAPAWRAAVMHAARAANTSPPFLGPVTVGLVFRFARPKGHYGTGRNAAQLKSLAPVEHITKPDVDKLSRAILDALTKAEVIGDDSQVANLLALKRYALRDEPGVAVTVREICE